MNRFFLLAALMSLASAAEEELIEYTDQAQWDGVCTTGRRQSPIAITSSEALNNDQLVDLVLSGWSDERDGIFHNDGNTVKFTPVEDPADAATMVNHQGTYRLLQFHLHWGQDDGVGSEHVVDGIPASAEIHFVHELTNDPSDGTAGNSFAVVGVMAVADPSLPIAGVLTKLNVTAVRGSNTDIDVAGIRYSDMLPANHGYFYYLGSLTTPGCSEVVQWFLLEETIRIPAAYLQLLREISRNSEGDPLTFNYRDTQPLNGRTVSRHDEESGGERLAPLLSLTLISLLLSLIVFVH